MVLDYEDKFEDRHSSLNPRKSYDGSEQRKEESKYFGSLADLPVKMVRPILKNRRPS